MGDGMTELSVVVATLKDESEIECLEGFDDEDWDRIELIVRDDEGICAARNAGVRESTADRIVFLDDDAVPGDGYVDRAIELLDEYAVVAGRVVDTGHHWIGKTIQHYDQGDRPRETDGIVGCNMGFRREVFDTVGLFDEHIEWGHDEREFADRFRTRYDIHYDPQLYVMHPYASDLREYLRKLYRLGVADVYYWKKHDEPIGWNALTWSISPRNYVDRSAKGTAMKGPAGVARTLGRTVGYLRYRSGRRVFG